MSATTMEIEFDPESGRIFVGGDITGPAIWAVGEFIVAHHDGEPYEIFAMGEEYGLRFDVTKIPNPFIGEPDDGEEWPEDEPV